MKNITSFVALMLVLFFFPMQMLEAHPGRTDANGGHTCRTNCEKWGLQYGQYHYHNGGGSSSSPSKSTAPKTAPKKPSTPKAQPPVALQQKTIVAVDNAKVYSTPSVDSTVAATLWYGFEIKDSGKLPDFVSMDQGYVSKNLLFTYSSLTPKAVKIHAEKGYFFSTASSESTGRGYALKDTLVQVVGESGDWYYGSTKDANGNVLVGFVSKSVAY